MQVTRAASFYRERGRARANPIEPDGMNISLD